MDKKEKSNKKSKGAEKILKTVTEQLNSSLTSLKGELGDKKFKKRIKKAAKKLVAGIKNTTLKNGAKRPKKSIPVKKKAIKIAPKNSVKKK